MPHFPPNQFPHFTGPNFSVSNDRVLNHLRVQQPNTFKVPPATKNLIDPNVPVDPAADPIVLIGDNDPATNSTLRSGVAQAGALVYSTTPIIASETPTGCFDGRNHLYFSDGDQWIPLANCLPSLGDCQGAQYAQVYAVTQSLPMPTQSEWTPMPILTTCPLPICSSCFTNNVVTNQVVYTGTKPIVVQVSLAGSYALPGGSPNTVEIGISKNGLNPTSFFTAATTVNEFGDVFKDATVIGITTLNKGDYLQPQAKNADNTLSLQILRCTLNIIKIS